MDREKTQITKMARMSMSEYVILRRSARRYALTLFVTYSETNHHTPLFCLMIRYRKIGAPINDVITPTGIVAVTSMAREMMSHPNRNAPPTTTDAGMTKR